MSAKFPSKRYTYYAETPMNFLTSVKFEPRIKCYLNISVYIPAWCYGWNHVQSLAGYRNGTSIIQYHSILGFHQRQWSLLETKIVETCYSLYRLNNN